MPFSPFSPLTFHSSPLLLWTLLLSWPLSGSRIRSVFFSYPALLKPSLCWNLHFPETVGYLFHFRSCTGCASDAELQSHRWILAPGLSGHTSNSNSRSKHTPCDQICTCYDKFQSEFIGSTDLLRGQSPSAFLWRLIDLLRGQSSSLL